MKMQIKVNNISEFEEVHSLLTELGYSDYCEKTLANKRLRVEENPIFLITDFHDGKIDWNRESTEAEFSLTTIEQLRDMTKPKEYLDIANGYTYIKDTAKRSEDWIEIPDGAEMYLTGLSGPNWFAKNENNIIYSYGVSGWDEETIPNLPNQHYSLLWSRHTQPEELPFVDDGLTDTTEFIQSNTDQVNNPQHYTSGTIECIDAIESSMSKEAFAGFLKGNVQKYMWRYENKGGVESLQKAQWYLNRLILLQSAHD